MIKIKVFTVQGSPRKIGNTAMLLKHYLKGIEENNKNTEIESVYLESKEIKPCKGCSTCRREKNKCIIEDDMQELYVYLNEADVIVLATPVYYFNITAQLKTFIDRLYGIVHTDAFINKNKKLVLLMTHGGKKPNSGAKLIESTFEVICGYLKECYGVDIDFYQVYGTSTGTEKVINNIKAQKEAYNLGKSLEL